MRKNSFRLKNVMIQSQSTLEITYTDGSLINVEIESLITSFNVFQPLEDQNEFASAIITDFGFTIEWSLWCFVRFG